LKSQVFEHFSMKSEIKQMRKQNPREETAVASEIPLEG
jgi:hypothetical protein